MASGEFCFLAGRVHTKLGEIQATDSAATETPKNQFDNLGIGAAPCGSLVDELQDYLASNVENVKESPLTWWYSKRHLYPRLARMAMDYLSIPGACTTILILFTCC